MGRHTKFQVSLRLATKASQSFFEEVGHLGLFGPRSNDSPARLSRRGHSMMF